jgi:hypothetical protein
MWLQQHSSAEEPIPLPSQKWEGSSWRARQFKIYTHVRNHMSQQKKQKEDE